MKQDNVMNREGADVLARKVGTGKFLERRLTMFIEGLEWIRATGPFELFMSFWVAIGIGTQQDVSSAIPLVAIIDAAMGPIDEMLLGATPEAILLEVIRRLTGYDVIGWVHQWLQNRPTWLLTIGTGAVIAAVTGADIAAAIPGFGTVVLPWEFVDQWVVGLPLLLVARVLYQRTYPLVPVSRRLDGPASSIVKE